jgi:hypothetical protein
MTRDDAKQATPHEELIARLLDSRGAKSEVEWAAKREIERLQEALTAPAAGEDVSREAAISFMDDVKNAPRFRDLGVEAHRLALEKFLSRLRAVPQGWRDIETAPRDGTQIIGGYFNQPWAESHREGRIVGCWWQPEFSAFISSARQMVLAPGYTFRDGGTQRLHSPVIETVTHWMPLPAAPAPEKGVG